MSDYNIPGNTFFEPCPDSWAQLHVYYNPGTKQVIPARCKRWNCFACAKINYYKVDHLINLGAPQRFITLSRAGKTPQEISFNLKHLIQGLRRKDLEFEYLAATELHRNGQPHLHLLQRGSFVPQAELSDMWKVYTAKSYGGKGSFIVDIRKIDDNQNVKGYLLKYLKKTWDKEKTDAKSWATLQAKYPGLHHYRMSRNWLIDRPEKVSDWQLVPKSLVDIQGFDLDPIDELFYTGNDRPLTGLEGLGVQSRKKVSRA